MFIVSREYGVILNINNVVEIYTGSNGTAIAAKQIDGKMILLAQYETKKQAKEAIEIISDEMQRHEIVHTPGIDEINSKIALLEQRWHHATGKKQKDMVAHNGI